LSRSFEYECRPAPDVTQGMLCKGDPWTADLTGRRERPPVLRQELTYVKA
jgi:hypothetical protein